MTEEMIRKMIEEVIWSLLEINQESDCSAEEVSEKTLLYQCAYNDALVDVRKCLLDRLDNVVIG